MAKTYNERDLKTEYMVLRERIDEVDRDIAAIEQNIREGSNGDSLPEMNLAMAHKNAMEDHLKALTGRMQFLGVALPT
jgi:hypothetical protein